MSCKYGIKKNSLQTAKVTFKLTQGHIGSHATWQAIYDFLFVFHCNYVCMLHRFRDIIAYFPKFKDDILPQPRPVKGQFVIPILN